LFFFALFVLLNRINICSSSRCTNISLFYLFVLLSAVPAGAARGGDFAHIVVGIGQNADGSGLDVGDWGVEFNLKRL
jgi:hypothetical protein